MHRVWIARILYYLFYILIFFVAVIIFIEIMNIDLLNSDFGNFLINLFRKMQF